MRQQYSRQFPASRAQTIPGRGHEPWRICARVQSSYPSHECAPHTPSQVCFDSSLGMSSPKRRMAPDGDQDANLAWPTTTRESGGCGSMTMPLTICSPRGSRRPTTTGGAGRALEDDALDNLQPQEPTKTHNHKEVGRGSCFLPRRCALPNNAPQYPLRLSSSRRSGGHSRTIPLKICSSKGPRRPTTTRGGQALENDAPTVCSPRNSRKPTTTGRQGSHSKTVPLTILSPRGAPDWGARTLGHL